jgi:GH25 family lysozyme M1 (1,4-beta-N-acetylmuramidase)
MSHSTSRARLAKVVLAAALAVPAAFLAAGPASAAPAPAQVNGPMTHPELDFAGSTIAAHEGVEANGVAPKLKAGTPGIDVSHWQGSINWGSVAGSNRFVYMKATEGLTYRDPNFNSYYSGSYNAGMIRGAYHFATPNSSSGAAQADYFVSHGGGWSADGHTMPPMLDIEYNPYGATCYGLSTGAMSQWIADFSNRVQALTTRWPVIYTTTNWWNQCTGGNAGFGANNPLFIARYASSVGALPPGWGFYTIWQYSSTGSVPGVSGNCDVDTFNGSADRLLALANNTP